MARRFGPGRDRIELSHVSAEGVVTDLTYNNLCYWIRQVGLGMSPIRRLTEQGPDQDGVTDLGFRLDQRMIGLVLGVLGHSPEVVEAKQERLYELFKPRDVAYSLRLKHVRTGEVRQIDCHTTQGPDFASDEEREGQHGSVWRATIQVYAPNPVFYDPTVQAITFGLTGGGGAWTIPWAIPWGIGAADLDQTVAIVYDGQFEEFPVITVQGPITDLVITNLVTNDYLSFVGAVIGVGDTYTIDLRPGKKTIVDQTGTNQISKLVNSSDLATFSLIPDPDAPGGINSIRVTGTNVSTATQIYLRYYNRYVGGR